MLVPARVRLGSASSNRQGEPVRPIHIMGMLAFLGALFVTIGVTPESVEQRLIRIQLSHLLPAYAHELDAESVELRAQFIDFADDAVLAAKARIALARYPEMARDILTVYGDRDEFRDALREYGEHVLLPIRYFMLHEVRSVAWLHMAGATWSGLRQRWGGDGAGDGIGDAPREPLDAEERGWYAVHFIREEGHGFLGQFVLDGDRNVQWIQSERALEALGSFFAGGVRGLETKYRRDEAIGAGDFGWAAVDLALGVSAVKVLRLGRAGATAGSMTYAQRSAALGASMLRGSRVGLRLAKYGAPVALAYLAVSHPSLMHALMAKAAETLGLPAWAGQLTGWTLLLWPILWLASLLLGPLALALRGFAKALGWCDALVRRRGYQGPA